MQTLKNKAFRVSIQWNALVRKLLFFRKGRFHAIMKKALISVRLFFRRFACKSF